MPVQIIPSVRDQQGYSKYRSTFCVLIICLRKHQKKAGAYFANYAAMLEFLGIEATESNVEEKHSTSPDAIPKPEIKVIYFQLK